MKLQVTPVFHSLNQAYLSGKYRVFVLEGGSRSSKSHSIIQFWILWAQNTANYSSKKIQRVVVARLKGTWVSATVLYDFLNVLKELGFYSEANYNKTHKIYRLFTTEFWFVGLDDPQKIHGLASDAFWINEAIEADKDDFDQLEQRCSGFGILDYNPSVDEHWIYERVCKRPDAKYIHSTMLLNPFIPENSRRKILSYEPTDANYAAGTADRNKWEIYGLGLRAKLEGVVFENWDVVKNVPVWASAKQRYGVDFGYTNDVTAIGQVFWAPGTSEVWLNEVCYETGMMNPQIGRKLIDNGLKMTKGYADSSEPKSIAEIHMMGVNIHPVKKTPIVNGIDVMKRYKMHVTESSINLIKELKNYKWMQDMTGRYINKPVDDYNHMIDAVRYVSIMELDQKREGQKTQSKSALGFY